MIWETIMIGNVGLRRTQCFLIYSPPNLLGLTSVLWQFFVCCWVYLFSMTYMAAFVMLDWKCNTRMMVLSHGLYYINITNLCVVQKVLCCHCIYGVDLLNGSPACVPYRLSLASFFALVCKLRCRHFAAGCFSWDRMPATLSYFTVVIL